jgi:hypothetical protein
MMQRIRFLWRPARRPSLSAIAAVLACAGLVGACDGVTIYEPMYTQIYSNGSFDHAARNGVIKTEIVGDPFGGVPNFAQTVTELLRNSTRSVPV